MRILHAPNNTAGQPFIISRAQRELGEKSDVLVFKENNYFFGHDINLNLDRKSKFGKGSVLIKNFVKCLFKYDVFHFHSGDSLLPFYLDLPILKLFRKKIIMQYWGSDIIQIDVVKGEKIYLWSEEDIKKIYPKANDEDKRRRIRFVDKWADVSIVGDYSLSVFSPKSIVIRQGINLKDFPFVGCKQIGKKLKILHAPTNRMLKGTEYVLKAVKELREEGYEIDLILVEKKSHKEAVELYEMADIVVDDILQGPYGILAIECMALGKPVLVYIREEWKKYYPGLPIVSSNPNNVYDNLKYLIENPLVREELGKRGREYVEKNHDSVKIAEQLIRIYEGTKK